MANEKKQGLSTNSNAYTLIYAAVLVIIVAFLLSAVSSALKPAQVANERKDKKGQILSALNIAESDVDAAYEKYVKSAVTVNAAGESSTDVDGFEVDFNKESTSEKLPLYICEIEGQTKYVLPLKGNGLWGAIWGYIALDEDKSTVYGVYFGHESETAGLGAEITSEAFQSQFAGKHVKNGNEVLSVAVLKKNTKSEVAGQDQVDAISGATLTCNGVNEMLAKSLAQYNNFLTK